MYLKLGICNVWPRYMDLSEKIVVVVPSVSVSVIFSFLCSVLL